MGAADQGIDVAFACLLVQVHAVFCQRGFLFVAVGDAFVFIGLWAAIDGAAFAKGRVFGDAVRDEIDGVVARHILFLQEVGGVAFAFGKDCDQHVCARDFGAA